MRITFQTKILLPVVTLLIILMGITTWAIGQRVTRQFESDAQERLATANKVFKRFQTIHQENLLSRYRNLATEPRVKAISTLDDRPTLQKFFADFLKDLDAQRLGADAIIFTSLQSDIQASSALHPQTDLAELASRISTSVKKASETRAPAQGIVSVRQRLYHLVSVPVEVSGHINAVLSYANELGQTVANDIRQITGSDIAFLADGKIALSTLSQEAKVKALREEVKQLGHNGRVDTQGERIVLAGEHFFWRASVLDAGHGEGNLGYVLLSSYEQPYQLLRATQNTLMWASVCGAGLAALVLWVLIRKVTQPIRDLRDGAEAVGRGDFSRRVPVSTNDELGDTARTFNQMTENLTASRNQLEETVKKLQTTRAQLVQSEKLSIIGEFVAGVAHELNNPLTGVVGYAQLLNDAEVDVATQKTYSRRIVQSAMRCQRIVQNLLSFSRQHPPERRPVSLNDVLESVVDLLQYELRTSNIDVTKNFDPALPRVSADSHQLQQVFLNIINNARHAMEGRPNAAIVITTSKVGEKLRVAFQDNGPGIAPENLSRIFDPFFTTKEVGKGTGLGLSLSYGIIQEHGGSIRALSKPGEGATFIIELPVTPVALETERPAQSAPKPSLKSAVTRRLLAIDDEEHILQLTREILEAEGYRVDTASDGEAALKRLAQQRYDLILCDFKMPGLGGKEFYEQMLATDAKNAERVIFMTGDVVNASTDIFLKKHQKRCLAKPFSPAQLKEALADPQPPAQP
ncbi:MAG TPA: ATP-binding protein [Methylomirabilota bacterium]|nr:ATP-binding protein [Methylomirabilota bacterium]